MSTETGFAFHDRRLNDVAFLFDTQVRKNAREAASRLLEYVRESISDLLELDGDRECAEIARLRECREALSWLLRDK